MQDRILGAMQCSYRETLSRIHSAFSEAGSSFRIPAGGVESTLRRLQCQDIAGPALRASDVSDFGRVGFVADPFLYVEENGTLNLFFEVFNSSSEPTAVIGHAKSIDGGHSWTYTGVVLECARHASYPFVFESEGEIYLIPGLASTPDSPAPAKLFRATSFPHEWELENVIVKPDHPCIDTTVFRFRDVWWALVGAGRNDKLHLYYTDSLLIDDWTAHPANPVVEDRPSAGRPGGRPINKDNRLLMPFQDCSSQYGDALRVYEITKLDNETYADSPLFTEPILSGAGGLGWNSGRMHHLDLQFDGGQSFCAVDGDVDWGRNVVSGSMWSIGFGISEAF